MNIPFVMDILGGPASGFDSHSGLTFTWYAVVFVLQLGVNISVIIYLRMSVLTPPSLWDLLVLALLIPGFCGPYFEGCWFFNVTVG